MQSNFGEGAINNFINSNAQLNSNNFTPSQNFLAENFTLPQGEGDEPVGLTSVFAKRRFLGRKLAKVKIKEKIKFLEKFLAKFFLDLGLNFFQAIDKFVALK